MSLGLSVTACSQFLQLVQICAENFVDVQRRTYLAHFLLLLVKNVVVLINLDKLWPLSGSLP